MNDPTADSSPDSKKSGPISKLATDSEVNKRYQWPPARDLNLSYKSKSRNPVHSIITALPLIMLVTGLYIYYRGESTQTNSVPILEESIERSGIFTGLSATRGRHYLWLETGGVAKGVRIQEAQVSQLEVLVRDEEILVKMAPSVTQSTTLWAWYVEQSGNVFLNTQNLLR